MEGLLHHPEMNILLVRFFVFAISHGQKSSASLKRICRFLQQIIRFETCLPSSPRTAK